jgi:hypothetical protein
VLMYLTVGAKWSTGKVQLPSYPVIQLARGARPRLATRKRHTTWMPRPCCWNGVDVASTPYLRAVARS